MDNEDFLWLLRNLEGAAVKICETLSFIGDQLQVWALTNKLGEIRLKTSSKVTSIASGIRYI
jgi:hypothetical protein